MGQCLLRAESMNDTPLSRLAQFHQRDVHEMKARVWGWMTVAELRGIWREHPLSAALREVIVDIDQRVEDAWGDKSALKFWNSSSGEYSHATSWEMLCVDEGLVDVGNQEHENGQTKIHRD